MRIEKLDRHHSELPTTDEDRELGAELAGEIGDTLIDFKSMWPVAQWTVVAKALRIHGLKVAERRKGKT